MQLKALISAKTFPVGGNILSSIAEYDAPMVLYGTVICGIQVSFNHHCIARVAGSKGLFPHFVPERSWTGSHPLQAARAFSTA